MPSLPFGVQKGGGKLLWISLILSLKYELNLVASSASSEHSGRGIAVCSPISSAAILRTALQSASRNTLL